MYATDREDILEAINNKIGDLNGQLEEAINTIDEAQAAFNVIADLQTKANEEREAEEIENKKRALFLEAEYDYNNQLSIIQDYESQLVFFEGVDTSTEIEMTLPPCEPQFLYTLDTN